MDQISSLSMNPGSTPGSPKVTPADKATAKEKEVDTDTSSLASTSTITPDTVSATKDASSGEGSTPTPSSRSEPEVKTARERALAGLDKNNFETEVHQVMGTLNSWWGGVKKQVRVTGLPHSTISDCL
jgi:hypothetical protein